jgi:hypothetical protein
MIDPLQIPDEPPPILGTWKRVYTFVLIYLACVIAVFYWFTRHFTP